MCIDDNILKTKHSVHQRIISLEEMLLNISFKTFMGYTQNKFSASTDDIRHLFLLLHPPQSPPSAVCANGTVFSPEQLERLQ